MTLPPISDTSRELEPLLLDYFMQQGRKHLHRRGAVYRNLKSYLYIHQLTLAALTPKHMEAFLRFLHTQGMSLSYAASSFSNVRKFFDYLVERGAIHVNPAREILASPRHSERRRFSDDDLIRVFRSHHPRR